MKIYYDREEDILMIEIKDNGIIAQGINNVKDLSHNNLWMSDE
ncbi:MAG: hypothetical protein QG588_1683 [Candidatus Poribacteria bacterium]|nr:hypothetical protein [Candidatus Poribacteria bacterium]